MNQFIMLSIQTNVANNLGIEIIDGIRLTNYLKSMYWLGFNDCSIQISLSNRISPDILVHKNIPLAMPPRLDRSIIPDFTYLFRMMYPFLVEDLH